MASVADNCWNRGAGGVAGHHERGTRLLHRGIASRYELRSRGLAAVMRQYPVQWSLPCGCSEDEYEERYVR